MTPQELTQQIKFEETQIALKKEELARLSEWADKHYPHRCDHCGGTGGELQGGFCSTSQEEELWFEECDHCNHENDEGEIVNPLNINETIEEPFDHESAPTEIIKLYYLSDDIYERERDLYYLECTQMYDSEMNKVETPTPSSWGTPPKN